MTRNYCDSGVCMPLLLLVLGSMGCFSLTTGRSMIAVCSDLTWEIINFRGGFQRSLAGQGWGLFLTLVGKRVVTIRTLQSVSTGVK